MTLKLTLVCLSHVRVYDLMKNNPCGQIVTSQAVWKTS